MFEIAFSWELYHAGDAARKAFLLLELNCLCDLANLRDNSEYLNWTIDNLKRQEQTIVHFQTLQHKLTLQQKFFSYYIYPILIEGYLLELPLLRTWTIPE